MKYRGSSAYCYKLRQFSIPPVTRLFVFVQIVIYSLLVFHYQNYFRSHFPFLFDDYYYYNCFADSLREQLK